ncbi:conserved hypothetical protein [Histoplasma capsulatum G186AR]|uniref:Uncharacterized protein n=2 Tax=Ajellomyces capsulatus TaxID=5037 RepID=C0NU85_AJECG|nr:uncharacterized protein HCBG_06916 [Histoplasma capsulatum G186AR]EEH04965.1 conserved hypothetical protein [Histoplasma capsulatum G186AR]KAG5287621.1 hypothetical protein I7I52_11446 [Histoplasma capsulatum]QSS70565.1 hypothetical protein I7I50_12242 [Histoplasma capsulatum G186AR]
MTSTYSDQPRYRDDPSANEKDILVAEYNIAALEDAQASPAHKRRCGFMKGGWAGFRDSSRSIWTRISLALFKVVLFAGLVGFFYKGTFHGFKKQCAHSKQNNNQVSVNSWHDHGPSEKRDISVNTTTNSIVGKFPLYDSLNLTTVTGSIAVVIDPQPAHPEQPEKPARVSIKTESGSISVAFRLPGVQPALNDAASFTQLQSLYYSDKPSVRSNDNKNNNLHAFLTPRSYEVEIHTSSGSISGQIAFSNLLKLSTVSGSISANLIPLVFLPDEDEEPPRDPRDPWNPPGDGRDDVVPAHRANISIITSTETGSTHLSLSEPFFPTPPEQSTKKAGQPQKGKHIPRSITAHHIARGSGSLAVVYPPSWSGRVHGASSGKGHVHLGGEGLLVRSGNQTVADGVRYPEPEDEWDAPWWGASGIMNVTITSNGGTVDFFARGDRRGE